MLCVNAVAGILLSVIYLCTEIQIFFFLIVDGLTVYMCINIMKTKYLRYTTIEREREKEYMMHEHTIQAKMRNTLSLNSNKKSQFPFKPDMPEIVCIYVRTNFNSYICVIIYRHLYLIIQIAFVLVIYLIKV